MGYITTFLLSIKYFFVFFWVYMLVIIIYRKVLGENNMIISERVKIAKEFYKNGKTKSINWRISQLRSLEQVIKEMRKDIVKALELDLNKPPYESFFSEVGLILGELHSAIKHTKKWAKPKRVCSSLAQFPAVSTIYPEPYGTVLIMSPWNYPFQLTFAPLIGAIAAGNTAIIKPSSYSKHTSELIKKIIEKALDPSAYYVVTGGRSENQEVLKERFDYIFFTGSPKMGKIVMETASKNLTPVTLELGGKSPCIIDETADIKVSVKRILFGKLINSGQTCIAPDYLFVQETIYKDVVEEFQLAYTKMIPNKEYAKKNLPFIITERHHKRLLNLLEDQDILFQGHITGERQIPFTLINAPSDRHRLMQEEIFGPILPIIKFKVIDEVIDYINERERPLALYYFTQNQNRGEEVIERISYGGGCINDTILHVSNSNMPFGGIGNSGMGTYHGKATFDTFTHYKGMVKRGTFFDLPFRYHPYKKRDKTLPAFLFKW